MWIVGSNQKELNRGGFVNISALTEIVVRCASVDKAALGHHFQSEFPGFCSLQLPTPRSRASQNHISSAPLLGKVQVNPSPSFTLKEPPDARW